MDINIQLGNNIRKYRHLYGLSLKDLAEKLNKSISTVSKYENGAIALDIPTFMDITKIFNVPPDVLLESHSLLSMEETSLPASTNVGISYMYYYNKRVVKSLIETYTISNADYDKVQMFCDFSDYNNLNDCTCMYTGTYTKAGGFSNYVLHNQFSPLETVMISCIDNIAAPLRASGVLLGLSNNNMLPTAFKAIISPSKITDTDYLKAILQLSKEDLKHMKDNHYFSIHNFK